jgi:hypothetical protein
MRGGVIKQSNKTHKIYLRVPRRFGCLVSVLVEGHLLVPSEIDCIVGSMAWRGFAFADLALT